MNDIVNDDSREERETSMTDDNGQTKTGKWVPFTRGGSMLDFLEADTEEQAWANLVRDNPHRMGMGKQALQAWGFEVDFIEGRS